MFFGLERIYCTLDIIRNIYKLKYEYGFIGEYQKPIYIIYPFAEIERKLIILLSYLGYNKSNIEFYSVFRIELDPTKSRKGKSKTGTKPKQQTDTSYLKNFEIKRIF